MNKIVEIISNQENWLIENISFSLKLLIISYLLIILAFQWFKNKDPRRLLYFMMSLFLFQSVLWYEKYGTECKTEFIIFHKSRCSVIGERRGSEFTLHHNFKDNSTIQKSAIQHYLKHEGIRVTYIDKVPKYFSFRSLGILVVNDNYYPLLKDRELMVVLTNSPKINLARLIKELHPKFIVADGSNYKSYVRLWKETSIKTKTPFWYTGQKGAYLLK